VGRERAARSIIVIAIVFGNIVLRHGFDSGIISSEEIARMIYTNPELFLDCACLVVLWAEIAGTEAT
jgi:hypothetical protein